MNVRRQGYKEGMGNTFGLMETVHIVNIKVALYMTTVIFVKIHILGHKRLILSLINYNATNLTSKEKKKNVRFGTWIPRQTPLFTWLREEW